MKGKIFFKTTDTQIYLKFLYRVVYILFDIIHLYNTTILSHKAVMLVIRLYVPDGKG